MVEAERLRRPWNAGLALRAGWGRIQASKQRGDGFLGGDRRSRDRVVCEASIDGMAGEETCLGRFRVGEDGAGLRSSLRRSRGRRARVDGLQQAAVEEGGEGRVEKDGGRGGGLLDQQAIGKRLGCASAKGQDDIVAAQRCG